MTLATRLYVGATIAAGALVLGAFTPREYANPALALTWLAAMVVVSLFKLRLPLGRGESTMSMAYIIDFAVIVTAGADLAMVIAAVGVLVQCTVRVRRRQAWYRTAFSVAVVALAVQAAGQVWALLGGTIEAPGITNTVVPLALCAVIYFALNTGLVALAIALSQRMPPVHSWWRDYARTAPAYFVAAACAMTVQLLLLEQLYVIVPAAVVPALACYAGYAFWFRHLAAQVPGPDVVLT